MAGESLKDNIPPHNEDAERAALGAMLISDEAVSRAALRLDVEDFYSLANGKIFRAIKNIHDSGGRKADIISVCDELSRLKQLDEAGGEAYVSTLTSVVPTHENIEYYIDLIHDNAVRRALISVGGKIIARSFDISQNSKEILEQSQQFIYELIERRHSFKYNPITDLFDPAFKMIEGMYDKEYTGIRSGYTDLDKLTRGFQKSEMIVIGARPSIGKTTFALNMAANIAFMQKVPTAFFSLEMTDVQLVVRTLASEARVDLNTARALVDSEKGKSFNKIQEAAVRANNMPLFIEAMPNMQLMDLRTQARHIREKEKVEIIFIDYLGLISVESRQPRYEQISEISRSLKGLARELNIPIVVLSQLVRAAETERPTLATLRDSGSVEQDADVVMLLHRARKPDPEKPDIDYIETEIMLEKNRNGPTGIVKLKFKPQITRFETLGYE